MLVEDGYVLGLHRLDAVGDEVLYRPYLPSTQRPAQSQIQEYGCRGLLLLLGEQAFFGHGYLHARPLDFFELVDRSREFAFCGPLEVDFLLETGDSEPRAVEYLVSDAAASRQPVLGKRKPRLGDPLVRYEDRVAAIGKFVRDTYRFELIDDLGRVAILKVGEKHLVLRGRLPKRNGEKPREGDGKADTNENSLLETERLPDVGKLCV